LNQSASAPLLIELVLLPPMEQVSKQVMLAGPAELVQQLLEEPIPS